MYRIGDKTAAITVVQEKLQSIGNAENIISLQKVVPNGIYDEKTRNAVYEFQKASSLSSTGTVNEATFAELVKRYRIAKITNDLPERISYPLKEGHEGDYMTDINSMLKEVYEDYYGISEVRINTYFSKSTSEAVREIQKAFFHDINGEIDGYFHKRLSDEVDSIRNNRKGIF